MLFAERLKELRKSRKIKQSDMAEFLSITTRNYQDYEYGKIDPPTSKLIKLANYFDVSLDYLVGKDEQPVDEGRLRRKFTLENSMLPLSSDETLLLMAFRKNPDKKPAVFRLLDIDNPDETLVYRVARSLDHHPPKIEKMLRADVEKLKDIPPITSDEDL